MSSHRRARCAAWTSPTVALWTTTRRSRFDGAPTDGGDSFFRQLEYLQVSLEFFQSPIRTECSGEPRANTFFRALEITRPFPQSPTFLKFRGGLAGSGARAAHSFGLLARRRLDAPDGLCRLRPRRVLPRAAPARALRLSAAERRRAARRARRVTLAALSQDAVVDSGFQVGF